MPGGATAKTRGVAMRILRKGWRVLGPLLVLLLAGCGFGIYQAQLWVSRRLPAYLSQQLGAALGRPVTVGRVSLWPLGAFSVRDIRVPPIAEESAAPLVARQARVYISWWDLLLHRRIRVSELWLDDPRVAATVDLRKPQTGQADAVNKLLSLTRFGLQRLGVQDGQVDVTTILRTGERQPVTARNVDAALDLKPTRYHYRLSASRWSGGGLAASDVLLAGAGDARALTIRRSRARFQGGTLAANGTYVVREGDVAMKVQARELPLSNLAPQIGIPSEWGVRGRLTGLVEVSAASGALRAIDGTLRISRGSVTHSQAVFPWTSASARVEWKPARVTLRDIDVQGNGIRMRGSGTVDGDPDAPLARRPFQARGTVDATRTEAVASLAQLLAFSNPVQGRWGMDRVSVTFDARGTVGRLQAARANGHFQAAGLVLHPTPRGAPLVVRAIEGDLERWPNHLHLRNVRAAAEGLTAKGGLTVYPGEQTRLGRFETNAQVDLTSLATLRQQLPDLPLWRTIDPATPASRGRITFSGGGSTNDPKQAAGTGGFRFQEFTASVPPAAGAPGWKMPVRELTGSLRLKDNRLALNDVSLRSDLFTAAARAVVADPAGRGRLSGTFRVASGRWAELPPLRGRVPKGLSGGTLVVEAALPEQGSGFRVQSSGGAGGQGRMPLDGTAKLTGAVYTGPVGGREKTIRLESSTARFRVAGGRVEVPSYRLVTPLFRTSGHGTGLRQAGADDNWLLRGEGTLVTEDAGALARWASGSTAVEGGSLAARYTFSAPSAAPRQAVVTAKVRLTDAQPRLPAGTLPFGPEDSRIRSLTGTFALRDGALRFDDAVWVARGFRVTGDGSLVNRQLAGSFRLTTPDWQRLAGELARSLPVAGGELTVSGRVAGPVDNLSKVPLRGTVTLRGARLASDRNASVPVEGGVLDLKADVNGPLTRLVGSEVDGTFSLRDLLLPAARPGRERVRMSEARGHFHRSGTRVTLTDLAAAVPGARLTGSGELLNVGTGQAAHRFSFGVSGPSLAGLLPVLAPVPGSASGGRFEGTLELSGTARERIARMEGRASVRDAEWTPPGQKTGLKITLMTAHFTRRGSEAILDNVEFRTPGGQASLAGTLQGLGTPAGERHAVRLTWRLEDASGWAARFLPVPGGFTGGLFTGEAKLSGTAKNPSAAASGSFQLRDTGFMPPQRFLGGPVKPITVRLARGVFTREAGRTVLQDLDLDTTVGKATGQVVAQDGGSARIDARAEITRLDDLVDLWPGFKDRLRGGRGELTLALSGPLRRPRDLAGPVTLIGRNGTLTVAGVDELYAEQPFDELSTRLTLQSGGAVRLEQVRMRGPKANLDGQGLVTVDGRVRGEGKGWFTEQFTKKLVKPRILWPIAKLVGYRRLKSDFKVDGTMADARLHLGITRSLAWKLAIKKKVPEPLRKIALGEAPLWSGEAVGRDRIASSR